LSRVRIVTDSAAQFEDRQFIEDYDVVVAPLTVRFGTKSYKDGVEIDPEEMLHRIRHTDVSPSVTGISMEDFEEIYQELAKSTDQICVLTHSAQFTDTFANALSARSGLLGRCEIAVIDSRTASAGLGYLVEEVAHAAAADHDLDEVVQVARGTVPRLYSVFYVSTLEYIERAGLIHQTQAILGSMLDIKPLLTIEDGALITMEKARTHSNAIDKMIEFVTEFTQIERLCILQHTLRTTDRTRMLQDRLALEFSRLQAPLLLYEPLTASWIGPDAMGMVILEGE